MADKPVKLFTWRHWALGLTAGAVGSFFRVYQEYRVSGSVKTEDLAVSILTFVVCFAVVAAVAWHGNRPGQKGEK